MGARRLLSDPATEPWNVWSIGCATSDMDLITLENSDMMPGEVFSDVLRDCAPLGKWFVVPLILDSTELQERRRGGIARRHFSTNSP
jgi:hypothetical protein